VKAIRLHDYGLPEQLVYEEVPIPPLKPLQVRIRTHAASVNPVDYKIASGLLREYLPVHLPWVPGVDFSGVVEAVGAEVRHLKLGDAVYGNCQGGGAYAELLTAPAATVALKPTKLSHAEAASVPAVAQTAWHALFTHGHLRAGETVLIHAGAGGVGTFAVQLAHWIGATVLATASHSNVEYLRWLGADQVIEYAQTPFETVVRDLDLVLDLVGGETQKRSFPVLKTGGRLVSTVPPLSPEAALYPDVCSVVMRNQPSIEGLRQLAELLDAGLIKPVVTGKWPLSEASHAWRQVMTGHTRGKVVLQILA
jgi:NADPH:quinone reductase-like Zn-dependent oxidoreductase